MRDAARDVHGFWSPRLAAASPRAVPSPSRGAPGGAQRTVPRGCLGCGHQGAFRHPSPSWVMCRGAVRAPDPTSVHTEQPRGPGVSAPWTRAGGCAGKPCPAARKATRGWEIAPTAGPWGSVFALSAGRFLHRPLQWQLVPAEELCSGSLKAWWKPSCLCRLCCDLPRHGICQISNKKCLSSWKELNKLVSSLKTAGRHQKWELCAFPEVQERHSFKMEPLAGGHVARRNGQTVGESLLVPSLSGCLATTLICLLEMYSADAL